MGSMTYTALLKHYLRWVLTLALETVYLCSLQFHHVYQLPLIHTNMLLTAVYYNQLKVKVFLHTLFIKAVSKLKTLSTIDMQ